MKVSEIMRVMEGIAPARLAEQWDKIGLQVGDADADVRSILVAMTPTLDLLHEAVAHDVQMLVCHHPLIFKPLSAITAASPTECIAAGLLKHSIAFFAAHTNYDSVPGGVNDALAAALGLREVQPLSFIDSTLVKVAVFVPAEAVEKVSAAMCDAGAGRLGAYSHCTFRIPGTGTFMPLEGSHPYVGERNKLERVAEIRIESIVPEEDAAGVVAAIRRTHPYEMPAFDVCRLQNERREAGLGRFGVLTQPMRAADFIAEVARKLNTSCINYVGDDARPVSTVAVCGGAGGDLVKDAISHRCDVLVTGDVRYHSFLEARDRGLILADAGHAPTEWPGVVALFNRLKAALPDVHTLLSDHEMTMIRHA